MGEIRRAPLPLVESRLYEITKVRNMVLASHVIFGAYGFWLPNDPRGSWSDFVGAWELFLSGGGGTKVDTRRSLAARPHDRDVRLQTKERLKYPAVEFDDEQITAIASGFQKYAERSKLTIHACSIMPEHVHLVVARHEFDVEQLVIRLKGNATRSLVDAGIHPLRDYPTKKGRFPKCWARGEWKVFLNDAAAILRAIRYLENNPVKDGRPAQHWEFITPFDPSMFS